MFFRFWEHISPAQPAPKRSRLRSEHRNSEALFSKQIRHRSFDALVRSEGPCKRTLDSQGDKVRWPVERDQM